MKSFALFFLLISFLSLNSFAQKIGGFGGEISILSLKPNYRTWVSRTTGYEFFGGVASELESFKPNDVEVGLKYLHAVMYSRTARTYIGVVGKWKFINVFDSNENTSLPVAGVFIGKEWYDKRIKRKGFAIEVGYQFGTKEYEVTGPINHDVLGKYRFEEFPLILNLRYTLYKKRR